MWGWKAVERRIDPSVSLEQAKTTMKEEGFAEHITNPEHIIFRRAGRQLLPLRGERAYLEVALAKAEAGRFLQVRYDMFILFDTGDLERVADELVEKLKAQA